MHRTRAQSFGAAGGLRKTKETKDMSYDACVSSGITGATIPKKRNYFGQQEYKDSLDFYNQYSPPKPLLETSMEMETATSYLENTYPNTSRSTSPNSIITPREMTYSNASQSTSPPHPNTTLREIGYPNTTQSTSPPHSSTSYPNTSRSTSPNSNISSMEMSYPNSSRSTSSPNSYITPGCIMSPGYSTSNISSFLDNILQDQGLRFGEDGLSLVDVTEELNLPAWINGGSSTPLYISSPTGSGSGKEDGSMSGSCYSPVMSPLDVSQTMPPGQRGKDRKKKMFEQEPYSDEDQEKRRINAINAKKNRDMKKRELLEHKKKVESLQQVNQRCGQALRKTQGIIKELGLEVQQLKDTVVTRDSEIKAKNMSLRRQREEMALLKGHLDIIAGSLEENNPAKNLITSLLQKLPNTASPYSS